MADFPLFDTQKWVSADATVTAHSTTHTKGSWVELFSSTPFEVSEIRVSTRLPSGVTNYNELVDIGIGAPGSEVVIVENMYVSHELYYTIGALLELPFSIPQGTRVVMRMQSSQASLAIPVRMHLAVQGFMGSIPLNHCFTLGADTANSRGLQIDPGAVAGTKGAWVEFSSSLAYPISYLACKVGGDANTAMSRAQFNLDIGIGGAGSEIVIIPDLVFSSDSSEVVSPHFFGRKISIAAGQRLAARASCSITDATDRLFRMTMHGVH